MASHHDSPVAPSGHLRCPSAQHSGAPIRQFTGSLEHKDVSSHNKLSQAMIHHCGSYRAGVSMHSEGIVSYTGHATGGQLGDGGGGGGLPHQPGVHH